MSVSRLMLAASLIALALPAAAQTPEETAAAALDEAPVWDGHNDMPGQLRWRFNSMIGDFDFTHTLEGDHWTPGQMHTDIARLREGKVGVQWWSVYVSASLEEPVAVQTTIEQIDVLKRLIAENPDDMALALTSADVERALAEGKIAGMIGMEGGHSIGTSLAVLRQMYDLGARYMTLTHSANTSWADSATDDPEHDGLTDWGVKVVQEMARLGMLIDLSHVSEATMMDTLDATDAPVIFSHSGARAVTDHARNVPDAVLRRLPEHDGIVMVVALPGYISEPQRQRNANRAGEKARLESLNQGNPAAVEAGLAAWDQANPMPDATITDMADHIDHIRDVIGVDYIGIGGDYDGMASGPVGMEDVTGYPALFVELARRGYSKEDLEKIASRNMMRVLKKAEAYAASQANVPPIETPVS
ncbi:membrane dipeptidase [Aurantiacibacter xanthus]|uniref:Membrane dipeptidase n=1 Tax=Aurantiacibacter xanthus TaxID=1784712 RepID=A0A3A1P8I6_9SPHN|nr:dipeptidase [Aurantiacibacter xanthus]RIV89911.1 membrane dipeptidase [Aurantiacibacter xanthus]